MFYTQDNYIAQAKLLGRSNEFIVKTVDYANKLQKQGLPVIFSTFHFCKITGIDYYTMDQILNNRENFYKFYQIKKRKGGFRQIIVPFTNLRILQDYILNNILNTIDVNNAAKGFVKGKSILDNALPHKNQPAILNLDLLKFFEYNNEKRVYGVFKAMRYIDSLAFAFARITTVQLPDEYLNTFKDKELVAYKRLVNKGLGVLPQGAPTSPALSNIIR